MNKNSSEVGKEHRAVPSSESAIISELDASPSFTLGPRRQGLRVHTTASGQRSVDIRELIRADMEERGSSLLLRGEVNET